MSRKFNPTLAVFFICFSVFALTCAAGIVYYPLSFEWIAFLFFIQVIAVFVMFTPLHEAVHFIASKNRFLNEMVIWGTWPLFINYTYLFRKIHLSHHAKTNQGLDDPDHFTAHRHLSMRWLKSFLLIFYYYDYSLRHYGKNAKEWAMMLVSVFSLVGLTIASMIGPYSSVILSLWLLPSIVGTGLLAFANTAWPHHPGERSDRIHNTRILVVPKLLQWLMLNQNYHLVHHLKPNVPWYDYPKYWAEHAENLEAQGAQVGDFRLNWVPTRVRKSARVA